MTNHNSLKSELSLTCPRGFFVSQEFLTICRQALPRRGTPAQNRNFQLILTIDHRQEDVKSMHSKQNSLDLVHKIYNESI